MTTVSTPRSRSHGRQHIRQTPCGIGNGQLAREVLILDVNNQKCASRVLSHKAHCRTARSMPLAFDGEEAWLEVLGLADPPHPVHFLWSHWTLVQRVKRSCQIGG